MKIKRIRFFFFLVSTLLGLLLLQGIAELSAQTLPPERKVRKLDFEIPPPGYDPVRHDWCLLISGMSFRTPTILSTRVRPFWMRLSKG